MLDVDSKNQDYYQLCARNNKVTTAVSYTKFSTCTKFSKCMKRFVRNENDASSAARHRASRWDPEHRHAREARLFIFAEDKFT
jgi:hypothetical protein